MGALAKKGLTFPPRPLPAVKPPSDLTKSPISIAKINIGPTEPAQIYGSLDDAVAGSNPTRSIAPGNGLRYVSYVQEARVDGKPFVQLKSGEWMRASPAAPSSNFQGLIFTKTPSTAFGWVIDRIRAYSRPDYNSPAVGDLIAQNTVVQIYDTAKVDNMDWYMIGQDQWVPWQKKA